MSSSVIFDERQTSQSDIALATIVPHTQGNIRQTDLTDPNPPGEGINIALVEDIPPDGGYGWICTACVFLINAHTWVRSSPGHFTEEQS
jgi:hypothetical protein